MGADRREPLGATRDGPIQTRQLRRQRRGASPQKPRMHAGEVGPRRIPNRPRGRDSRPPLGSGVVAICLREHLGELASGP